MPGRIMPPAALERRCAIVRYLAAQGGTLAGVKQSEFAAAVEIPTMVLKDDLRRLKDLGVIDVTMPALRGQGRLPNEYRLLMSEKEFRRRANELLDKTWKQRMAVAKEKREATIALQRQEEQRALERIAKREEQRKRGRERIERARKGLPRRPPPPGEPEPKTTSVSDGLLHQLIEEGKQLPPDELAAWGA